MKTYEAIFEEDNQAGVFGISLVKKPAMEGNFIALSEHKPVIFKDVDREQRKVVGLVLEPNKLIYRNDEDGEYNIVFSSQTIQNLSYNFFKQKYNDNSTIEHDRDQKLENVSFVESWIVEDKEKDKQRVYGFDYPVGSWLAVLKIDDEDVWQNYVKTGLVQGFSIDGLMKLKEINNNNEINMSETNTLLGEIKELIKTTFSKKEKDIKLGEVKTADGKLTIMYEGESLEVGSTAYIMADDETQIPVPVGEHAIEGDKVIVVEQEGVIADIKSIEAPEEQPDEAPEVIEQNSETQKDLLNAVKSLLVKFNEMDLKFNELSKVNEDLKQDNKALKVALSEEPAKSKIKSTPTQLDLSKMSKRERLLTEIKNLK